jgi:protein-L-isoaspartate(D-aspartate) O-methyltransferase
MTPILMGQLLWILCITLSVQYAFAQHCPSSQAAFQLPFNNNNNNNNLPPEQQQQQQRPTMRAWFCDGKTQRNLVDHLREAHIIKSTAVQRAMEAVDRKYYLPANYYRNPYADAPQSISLGQTISAPHMHGMVLQEIYPPLLRAQQQILDDEKASPHQAPRPLKILDVGCGSGYLTACFGRWFQPQPNTKAAFQVPGKVYGMDIHNELVDMTRGNMGRADGDLLASTVELKVGNGWLGWPIQGPFDAIHVGAAAATLPIDLVTQLQAPHGVLIIPVGPQGGAQRLIKVERKTESDDFTWDDYTIQELLQVRYVPLIQGPDKLRP